MRTPCLYLGGLALALLLLLLSLACGASDEPTSPPDSERATGEPTDLPDSERASGEPEDRASSGQTAAASATEGGEPSPTPRANAKPPLAQTSPETDWEALVALYNSTGGPNWNRNNNWLSDMPISEWEGVTIDDNGRVTNLSLYDNQLSGGIPPELGNLASLETLAFHGNQLSEEIPPALGNLASLRRFFLDENQLTGEIPPELGNLASLTWFFLSPNPPMDGARIA